MGAFEAFRSFVRAGRKEEDIMDAMRRQKQAAFGTPSSNRAPGREPQPKPSGARATPTKSISTDGVAKPSTRKSSPLEAGGPRQVKANVSRAPYETQKTVAKPSSGPPKKTKQEGSLTRAPYETKKAGITLTPTKAENRPDKPGKFTLGPEESTTLKLERGQKHFGVFKKRNRNKER